MEFERAVEEFQLLALEANARRRWDRPAAEKILRAMAAHIGSELPEHRIDLACKWFRVAATPGHVFFGAHDGRIVPREGGFQAEVAPWLEGHAREFVLLHECAHTLFYSRDTTPVRLIPPGDSVEEELCDAFARAVLELCAVAHEDPYSHSQIDVRSVAPAVLRAPIRLSSDVGEKESTRHPTGG